MQKTNHNGSELHRLKPMQEGYDIELFEKLYKISKPVIRRLSKQVDPKRFNVTTDIIESYFWDKMLYIFNKYYGTCTEDHLQARVLGGLTTFKNHLLHSAYTERASFNQALHSFEDLYEDSNEDKDNYEDNTTSKNNLLEVVDNYMMNKLNPDAQLVYEVLFSPPPFIQEYPGYKGGRITNGMLIEFFDLPKNSASERFIKETREDIEYWIKRASKDLR